MKSAFADIASFLAEPRIALIGASHDPKDFSRALMRELLAAGYDVVPVNPNAAGGVFEGRRAFATIGDIATAGPPVGAALLMVPATEAAAVVRQCIAARVPKLWFHRGAGPGVATPEAVKLAAEAGLTAVVGECPLMFLPDTKLVHRAHGGIRKLGGRWPTAGLAAPRPGPWLVALLIVVQALIALPAIVGGSFLVADPSGAAIGLPTAWLASSPFADYLVPGLVLFAIGILHLAGALLTLRHRPVAGRAAVALGLVMAGFIIGQWLWVTPTSFLQFLYLALGLAEIGLGFSWFRHLTPAIRSMRPAPL